LGKRRIFGPVKNSPGLLKIVGVVGTCASITVALGFVNIWLGILAMPVLYEISDSFLSE
jgi:hypothetical protein